MLPSVTIAASRLIASRLLSPPSISFKWLSAVILGCFLALPSLAQVPAPPFNQCPAIGLDTSCRLLIVINASGGQRLLTDPNVSATYDGSDDTLIGVINLSPNPVASIPLTAPDQIFGFDGDGVCSASIIPHPAACPFGVTGYEGPGVSFSSINATFTSGTVNFNPPIPPQGTAYFGLEMAIPTQCVDTDGDGLCDDWEKNGFTVMVNGVPVFVNLPAMGADPNHKDIFIQADYMDGQAFCIPLFGCLFGHSHKPTLAAIALMTQAFASSPVPNPDGTTGVRIHVDCGPDCVMNPVTGATWGALSMAHSLPHQATLGTAAGGNYSWAAFDVIKRANFSPARAQAFHYLVLAHDLGNLDGTSGISRGITASDFIVSLGSWPNQTGTTLQQGGTIMHELGHNLSLQHGGTDGINFKPNFLSVMNYFFQTGGLIVNGAQGKFDYSRFLLPALNENALNENVGLNGGAQLATYGTMYYCQGAGASTFVGNANGPIDWNCNGAANQPAVATDINNDGARSILSTFNDWPSLVFTGGSIGGLGLSVAPPSQTPVIQEINPTIDATITKPLMVAVSSPGTTQVLAGASVDLTFTITNTGTQADSYALTASTSTPSWASLSGVPTSVSLAPGANTQTTIHVATPAGTLVGTPGTFTIMAVSATAAAIQDTGVATVTVVGGVPRLVASVQSQSNTAGTLTLNLQLMNQGPGPTGNVNIAGLTARTLTGSGNVSISSPTIPYLVGNLATGGVAIVPIVITVPSTVTRFTLTEIGTLQDSSGASANFSTSVVVQP